MLQKKKETMLKQDLKHIQRSNKHAYCFLKIISEHKKRNKSTISDKHTPKTC